MPDTETVIKTTKKNNRQQQKGKYRVEHVIYQAMAIKNR